MIKEIIAKSILHYHEQEIPTNWDANIYRGCTHGCKYCFAQYSHRYLDDENFFGDIYVKTNAGRLLAKELAKKSWRGETINICGVTDCYQPLEAKYKLMPQVLQACIDAQNPVLIATKSALPLRDMDLILELNRVAGVSISASITTLNEDKRKLLEPGAASAAERLDMLRQFAAAGCRTHVLLMPIIPYITDDKAELEALFAATQNAGINGIVCGTLNLRGNTKKGFFNFLAKEYPQLLPKYQALYTGSYAGRAYTQGLYAFLDELRAKYKFKHYTRKLPDTRGRIKPLAIVPKPSNVKGATDCATPANSVVARRGPDGNPVSASLRRGSPSAKKEEQLSLFPDID